MALRDLKSNLAVGDLATPIAENLTFGKGTSFDRPGQNFSNEPFIREGLDFQLSDSAFNSLTDGFIRGGAAFSTERRLEDVRRIGKFLITNRGISFLAKQVGLQKSNPKISEPNLNSSNADQRTYALLGTNTLSQIGSQGTGKHVNRNGLFPFSDNGYVDDIESKFKDNSENNRLIFLFNNHIFKKSSPAKNTTTKIGNEKEGNFFQNAFSTIKDIFISPGQELYSYNGGPGSTYGIGKTEIKKYSPTQGFQTLDDEKNNIKTIAFKNNSLIPLFADRDLIRKGFDRQKVSGTPLTKDDFDFLDKRDKNYENIKDYHLKFKSHNETTGKDGRVNPKIKNYLATLEKIPKDNYNFLVDKENSNKTFHRESRIGLGNPGSKPDISNTTVDLINALDVFKSRGDYNDPEIKDLIRFRIEAVNPLNPLESNVMIFRAFLDSLEDSFNANHNEFNYNGRGENFYTYNNFNRDISFSFKIAAQSSREMKPLYRKLNYLLSNTAPEYGSNGRIQTPFMRVTIGAYIDRLPGVISNVQISWDKNYPWEIVLNDNNENATDSGLFELPHVLNVSVNYKPIHNFLPKKGINSPFIIPDQDSNLVDGNNVRASWTRDEEAENIEDAISNRNLQTGANIIDPPQTQNEQEEIFDQVSGIDEIIA
tara:strand:- start:191 stop:2146 length:1956 start_codon:yes stop_codon:yes gene_type:complete